jgi:hypothetical protein
MNGWERKRNMIQTYVELCKRHLGTIRSVVDHEALNMKREGRRGEETHDVLSSKTIPHSSVAGRSNHLEILLRAIDELDQILEDLKSLASSAGIIDMCAECKRISEPRGEWMRVEEYVEDATGKQISHGLCPQCIKELYPGYESSTN